MPIDIRNKRTIPVTIQYEGQDYTIEPNKRITVPNIDTLIVPTNIVKINNGVINIKDE